MLKIVLPLLLLSGCAGTEISKTGSDFYRIKTSSSVRQDDIYQARVDAITKAQKYCNKQGKVLYAISANSFSDQTKKTLGFDLIFACRVPTAPTTEKETLAY